MPTLGETLRPGVPAPAAGVYQCTSAGCTSSFVASLAGAPLPSAHHSGAMWRLTSLLGHAAPPPSKSAPPGDAKRPV